MSEQTPKDLAEVESALSALAPASARIDRDYVLFHAGRASAPRGGWLWPSTSAVMTIVALALGWVAVKQTRAPLVTGEVRERIVYLPTPIPKPTPPLIDDDTPMPHMGSDAIFAYEEDGFPESASLRQRQMAFRFGVDALQAPSMSIPPGKHLTIKDLLNEPVETPVKSLWSPLESLFNAGM
jgi:hypothetical protein